MVNLSTTVRGTPTYNSGNAKFGSYGLSGGVIKGINVDDFMSSTGEDGGALNGTGTFEAWVKSSSSSGRKVFLQHSGWWYLCSDGSTLGLEWGFNTGNVSFISGGNITDGNWHHVAVVFNAGQPSIYVDGSRVNTSTTTWTATGDGTGVKSFAVGGYVPATGFDWPGSIDEVRVSNTARYSGTTYTVPTAAFTPDANTVGLYHLENNGGNDPLSKVKYTYTAPSVTTADPTVSVTDTPAAGDVLVLLMANSNAVAATAVSGCGATWSRVTGALSSSNVLDVWIGVGANASGTVTATATAAPAGKALMLHMVGGISSTAVGVTAFGAGSRTTPSQTAGNGQMVFGLSYSSNTASTVTGTTPAMGWTEQALNATSSTYMGTLYRDATGTGEAHSFTAHRPTGNTFVSQVLLGNYTEPGAPIDADFTGSGTLSTTLTNYREITSAFSGSGTLATTVLGWREIDAAFSGSGTLTSTVTGYVRVDAAFSGEGTLTTTGIDAEIDASFSGEGTLSTPSAILDSGFEGTGELTTHWHHYLEMASAFGGEGILATELVYTLDPLPLDQAPLGRLAGYNVSSSAVPLNPAEGSGSVPSVNPSYIAGTDPEYALGQTIEVKNNSIGSYKGEAVKVTVSEGSDVVALSTNTLLALANKDLLLAPFIDASPGTWTAARAIDYWTQQAGIFYDEVPGACAFYASGFGHTLAYGRDNDSRRFSEKTVGGATAVSVLNNRSVRSFGAAVTATTAMHEHPEARVPVVIAPRQRLVFSIGLGLRGTGRTASAAWLLEDGTKKIHTVTVSATSAGVITAKLGTLTLASTTVAADGNYRVSVSIERTSVTSVAAKLTVHTDDLAGTGTLTHNGAVTAHGYTLPGVLGLTSVRHTSTGGSGSEMLRWGTYLTLAKAHPLELPVVQKSLSQTTKTFSFVSGFEGNVWNSLSEYCSITRLDIRFENGKLVVGPRSTAVASGVKFSQLVKDSSRREKYRQVAVVTNQSKAVATDTAVLWRADSVYQLNTREVFETTIQTEHSILNVVNPVPVGGISPFPYVSGAGQYVVTGADGYIIAPQWWLDHGGKIEASLTGKAGEIALKMTAPQTDSVRAPYRISEGAADRPALYVSGSGVINEPKELHIATGATNAREGFDRVFSSPFIAGTLEAYDVASKMAREYSAAMADVSYEVATDFNTPSKFGQYPAGAVFTDNDRNYRLQDVTQTPSRVSGQASPHTTLAAYSASYPAGATIADEKARHAGRTIREFNIKPLRGN